jgi:aldose 1-epimerase
MIASAGLLLRNQAMRMVLDPLRGGAIRELSWRGRALLRPTPAALGDDPFDTACFPMVPYVNRVARGYFRYDGRSVCLQRNWSRDPHPLHGQGWRAPWSVVTSSDSEATLRFEGGGDDWPWKYVCEERCQLLADGLLVELTVKNLDDSSMPAMLGLHPYFPDSRHATLGARLPSVWLTDAEVLPLREVPTPAQWAFEPARNIAEQPLDNCFGGWDGVATLSWPDRSVSIHASGCKYLHVYSPSGSDFFCVEPQSSPPGALEREAGKVADVGPGKQVSIRVRFQAGAS